MSSSLNPKQIDPKDIPTLAPDVVLTRADFDVSKVEPDGKAQPSASDKVPPSASKKGATAGGATVPPVDTTFRAASTSNVRRSGARSSFGRRVMRGLIGMILTACIVGAAILWQSHGDAVRTVVLKWAPPFVLTLLSRSEGPADDQQPAPPAVQDAAAAEAPASSTPQGAGDNLASAAASAPLDQAQLLQSMARDLADLRQQMEQMKAGIAELKAGQDQMAREVVRASEPSLRPRATPVAAQPGQAGTLPARRPPPLQRPVQPRAVSPQAAAAYVPRQLEPRAVAPPPPSAAPPPTDLSAPRPPAPLREQVP